MPSSDSKHLPASNEKGIACRCSASGRSAAENPNLTAKKLMFQAVHHLVAYFCSSRRHKAMTRLSRQRSSPLEGPSMFQNFANLSHFFAILKAKRYRRRLQTSSRRTAATPTTPMGLATSRSCINQGPVTCSRSCSSASHSAPLRPQDSWHNPLQTLLRSLEIAL